MDNKNKKMVFKINGFEPNEKNAVKRNQTFFINIKSGEALLKVMSNVNADDNGLCKIPCEVLRFEPKGMENNDGRA